MLRNLFNPESDLMIVMTQITDALFLSFFWMLGSVLVVTAGPSTAALYDSVYRCYRRHDLHAWERFVHSFRRNFKTGCLAAIPVLAAGFLAADGMVRLFAAAVLGKVSWMVFSAAAFLSFLLLGVLSLVFPLLSRFETTVPQLLVNALRLAMGHLPRTLALAAINGVCLLLCVRYVLPMVLLPSLCMLASSFLIEPMLRPFMPPEELEDPEAEDPEEI